MSQPSGRSWAAPIAPPPVRVSRHRRAYEALAAFTAGAVTVSLAAVSPTPAAAHSAPRAAARAAAPQTRDDLGAARLAARSTGQRVEVLRERSETTQVFANPDGTLTRSTSARPQRVRRADGTWAVIDATLAASGGRIRPAATTADMSFSAGGTGPLVSVSYAGTTLNVRAPQAFGTLRAPTVDGSSLTYPQVLPGVDLKMTADGQGYSQVLVVGDATAAADPRLAKLVFPVSVSGGELSADTRGNLKITDSRGKPVLAGAAPIMWDSSGTRGAGRGRHAAVAAAATASAITVTPNKSLLSGPGVVYPLYIDPGVTVSTAAWSMLESSDPTGVYYNTALHATIGTYDSGTDKFRSVFAMSTQGLNGTHITAASLRLHETTAWDCTSRPFEVWATTAISASTTWNNPPTWSSLLGTGSSNAGGDPACPAADVSVPVTTAVQSAADAGASSTYLGVRVNSAHESDNGYYKQFDNNPVLDVTYNTKPAVPTGVTVSSCYLNCASPWKVATATPQLSAIVTDGDTGQRVQAEFQIRQGSTVIASGLSNSGTSGSWVYWSPATALSNGQTYTVRTRAFDGVDYSAYSADSTFTIDTTAPAAATVSSTTYPSGSWAGGADQAGTFTFGSSTDFAGFVYGLDENPPITAVQATSGTASVSLAPEVDGPHTLYVRSRDAAGNYGPLTTYAFNAGAAALTQPAKGQLVTGTTFVQAVAPSTATGYSLQWRRADTDTWTTVPTTDVTLAGGGAVTWPQTRVSGTFPKLTWNVAKTFNDAEAGPDALDGPVQARALLSGGTTASSPLRFTLDQSAAPAGTADVGAGAVNLVTGNLEVSAADATIHTYGADLSVARTFNTRAAAVSDPSAMFGPGWVSSVGVPQTQSQYTGLNVTGSVVQLAASDGSVIGFTAKTGGGYSPALGYESLTLTHPDAATYQVSDLDGDITTFTVPTGSAQWKPTALDVPGSAQTTTTSWETVTVGSSTVTRPTRLLAPVPAAVTCGAGVAGLVKGCRALSVTYATTTTATITTPGDYLGRASQISFTAWDPDLSTPAMRTIVVAKYAYDSNGRLVSAWDPRLDYSGGQHLAVGYAYDSNGILSTITPAAQQPWQLTYTTVPGDTATGRLKQVSRSALSAGTAVTTMVYQVPISGTGAPYDLSATQTSRWGQNDPPVQATAVFGPDQIPDGSQSTGTMPSSWTRAHLTYMDPSGQVVNTVEPGGYTTATWYDTTGNVVRSLSAANRDRALNASSSDTAADEAALAGRYATTNRYEAAGRRLKETFGPEHTTAVPSGSAWSQQRARTHTLYTYDESAPSGGPYDLVTSRVISARLADGTDADARTTTTAYNWPLRAASAVTDDPTGLNLTTRTTYDTTTGLTTSVTTPAGGTSTTTPRTTQTIYYTAAANSTYPSCGGHPEWANLACLVRAGGTPSAGQPIPDRYTTYDVYHQPETITEKTPSGTTLRTTTNTFDAAGRPLTVAKTATTGTALPTTKNIYDAATGMLTQTQSLSGTTVTAQVSRVYDTLGRSTQYTDADNATTTVGYDLLSRIASVNDGKGTQTRGYDNRGLINQLVDSQAGTITASYDADGNLATQTLPDTLTVTTSYDETATATARSTSEPGCTPATDCIDVDEQVSVNTHGQWATHSTDLSGQQYTYDKAGRLTRAQNYLEPIFGYSGCTTHVYGFDDASNRTSYASYAPAAGGGCQTSSATVSKTLTYDTADRATTSGYSYDPLGRTTTVPSAETLNTAGNVTVGYYVNDMVNSLTQAGSTTTYNLDVIPNRIRSITAGSTTRTHHYTDDSDAPSWTATGSSSYVRYITGADDRLIMSYDSASATVSTRLTDLHGNAIGIITGSTSPEIQSTYETDEFGAPYDPADVGDVQYGYLGQYQRATDNPAGISLMGVRLYNAATGRFLTVDPVPGGSASPYDYCFADPINCTDLDGQIAVVALVAGLGLGLSVGEVILILGAAALAGLVVYAVWHGKSAAIDKLRTMWNKATRKSGKEKGNDGVSPEVRGERRRPGESPEAALKRIYRAKGKPIPTAAKDKGPTSQWNKDKKYLSRN